MKRSRSSPEQIVGRHSSHAKVGRASRPPSVPCAQAASRPRRPTHLMYGCLVPPHSDHGLSAHATRSGTNGLSRLAKRLPLLLAAALPLLLVQCTANLLSNYGDVDLIFNAGTAASVPAADADPIFVSAPIFDTLSGRVGSHAPTLTALPDGTLLAAWYSYVGPDELDGAAIYLARRPAGTAEWETPVLHIDRAAADGNPVLYSEGDQVWLFQAVVVGTGWSTAHIELQTSTDAGLTWSDPRIVDTRLGSNVRHPPVRLADGSLLLPAYDDLFQQSLFYWSSDGADWTLRSTLATEAAHPAIQPSVVQLDDGKLLAVLRNAGRGWLWVTASADDGTSWAAPRDAGFANPASPACLTRLANGDLLLVLNDDSEVRQPLVATLSTDAGRTWLTPRIIAAGSGSYAYSAVAQTPDGLIHVAYSDDRERITHVTLNTAWLNAGG